MHGGERPENGAGLMPRERPALSIRKSLRTEDGVAVGWILRCEPTCDGLEFPRLAIKANRDVARSWG